MGMHRLERLMRHLLKARRARWRAVLSKRTKASRECFFGRFCARSLSKSAKTFSIKNLRLNVSCACSETGAKTDWLCQMHGFVLSDWQMLSLFSGEAQRWNQVALLLRQLGDGFSGFGTSFSSLSCLLRIRTSWESNQIHRASYRIYIWI
jgi:hypothetical protein